MIEFWLNNRHIQTNLPPGMVMLDFIRYEKNLKGTKIGCREGDCGACTVLVGSLVNGEIEYQNNTSCLMPLGNAKGKHIVTVEGINTEGLTPVQQAIVEEGGTQCGFCTVGFVMSMTGFCLSSKAKNCENGIAAIDGNICRCTGYKSLERAVNQINNQLQQSEGHDRLSWLVAKKYFPSYFLEMPGRLRAIPESENGSVHTVRVGGGTDLYVQKHDTMVHADIDFVFDRKRLNGIQMANNQMVIGAAVTVDDLKKNEEMNRLFPKLQQHLKLVSSSPIRNMATVAGNFVNASPIGDMTIFFMALNARITLEENNTSRTIYLKDLYKGYKTLDKTPGEEITSVLFDVPTGDWHFNFEKVSKRTHLDIASVNSALGIEVDNNLITSAFASAGGVFAFPRFLAETSRFLVGKTLTAATVLEAAAILQSEIAPISDARGDSLYKRTLARQLFMAHFVTLFPSAVPCEELWEMAT